MMCNPFAEQMVSPISHLAMLAAPAHRELKVTIILIVHVSIQSYETVALEKFRKNSTETFENINKISLFSYLPWKICLEI